MNMPHKYKNFNRHKALTLLEMVIALAIVSVLFAVVLPVFTTAGKSWNSRQASSEAIQNGRVLVDYINRELSKAVKIIAVSDPTETNGYIEYEDAAGTTQRFDIDANNYVQFGEIGLQSELAGPVTELQFTCYALDDLSTQITDGEEIRFIKVKTVLDNASTFGNDKTFLTSAYLLINGSSLELMIYTPYEFDTATGKTPALSQIDTTHYLCAYSGNKDDGWATVLTVDTDTWEITKGASFEFDSKKGKEPALSMIDSTHYLCVYSGNSDDGWATVLMVDTDTLEITKETSFEYDTKKGKTPALSQINSTHYLCVYEGDKDDGWSTVLAVDTDTWEITKGTPFEFDNKKGKTPVLAQIDTSNYLCAYTGNKDDGWATVLTVDMGTLKITKGTSFEYDSGEGKTPALLQADSGHYLCAYDGVDVKAGDAWATVLTVDASENVTNETPLQYDSGAGKIPALARIDTNSYLCAYAGDGDVGWMTTLTVNQSSLEITNSTPFEFDAVKGKTPAIAYVSDGHYLCAYAGPGDDGWAVVIAPGTGSALSP